ncbi:hypothetical protein SK128_022806, partial [Halocaridina rubra]
RSTLLPWLSEGFSPSKGGSLGGERSGGRILDDLDMSWRASPVKPPPTSFLYESSLTLTSINTHKNNSNGNNTFADAVFQDGNVAKMNRVNQLAEPQPELNFTFGSIVDDACPSTPDSEDLRQDLLKLEHTNRRLLEENAELDHQVTCSEESNSSLRQHCQQLEHALNNMQQQLIETRRMEEEAEEMRLLLFKEQEDKISCLEKENSSLTNKLKVMQRELDSARDELENHNIREEALIQDHKTEMANLALKLLQCKTEAMQKAEDAKEAIKELEKLNEALHEEKSCLEEQLLHVKGQLASMTSRSYSEVSGDVYEGLTASFSFSTPFAADNSLRSGQGTPLSIHSEIQTMKDNSGSLPFCEKSDDGVSFGFSPEKGSHSDTSLSSRKGEAAFPSLIGDMLKSLFDGEEQQCKSLMKKLDDEKYSALDTIFHAQCDKLVKLVKELENIRKKRQDNLSPFSTKSSTKTSSFYTPSRRSSQNGSEGDDVEVLETPCNKTSSGHTPRTPGPCVSMLISKFEQSSQASSPVTLECSERIGLVDYNSNVAKSLEFTAVSGQDLDMSSESKESKPTQKYDFIRDSKILNRSRIIRQEAVGDDFIVDHDDMIIEETCKAGLEKIARKGVENAVEPPSVPSESEIGDVPDRLDSGFEQDGECSIVIVGSQPVHEQYISNNSKVDNNKAKFIHEMVHGKSVVLHSGLDGEDSGNDKDKWSDHENEENMTTPLKRRVLVKCNTASSTGSTTVEMDTDMFMENSQLMKLMKEVKQQEDLIQKLKQQVGVHFIIKE